MDAGQSIVSITVGLGIANTFTAFTTFTPSLADIRNGSAKDTELVGTLRHGEFAAVTVGGGVAAAASIILKDPLPLITSFLLLVGLVVLYEYTLSHAPFSPRGNPAT